MLNRRHVRLEHFVKATEMCGKAGFRLRNLEVNAFVLYGLPHEQIDHVVKTVLFVSEVCGSIIPMLFASVPSTGIFREWLPWFKERGWHRRIERLNGKLYPFLEINEGGIDDLPGSAAADVHVEPTLPEPFVPDLWRELGQ